MLDRRPARRNGSIALLAAGMTAIGSSAATATRAPGGWPLPNLDVASTRAATSSTIDRSTVRSLHVAWRFRFRIRAGESGAFTATPVVSGGVVFVQDMKSNVFALDLETGRLRWRRAFGDSNPGPNGLAVAGRRVYGATDTTVFALSISSGRLLWTQRLVTQTAPFVDVAPLVANGTVYAGTVGLPPAGQGVVYAIDAETGKVRWQLSTIKGRWRFPQEAGGGGVWYPPSIAGDTVLWGTANPYPYGGTRKHPNGGAFPGPALYTDSLLAVDRRDGRLSWYDQVTPHDVRDYDFALPPVVGSIAGRRAVFGAGKAGLVIAWDLRTRQRVWQREVGIHRNDKGPLPRRRVPVCPGLLGGVVTPMAYADGRLYLPVVDLCMRGSAYGFEDLGKVDVTRGKGELVALDAATGARLWTHRLPQPDFGCATVANGLVFTSTFDGTVYALDAGSGAVLWRESMSAGINACPAVASNWLLVGAGVQRQAGDALELAALTTGQKP